MGTVEVITKQRMLEIEAASVVSGEVNSSGELILEKHDGTQFNAGSVRGADATALMTISPDTTSVELSLDGAGTPASPWELSAQLRSQEVTDWNNATAPGFYWAVDPLNAPASGSGYWWIGYVYRHEGSGRPIQEIRRSNSALMQSRFVRYWTGTAWTEWLLDGGQGQGTTAARDLLFTPPTTDVERVALANRRIRWYNTDLGWEESYYAVTGLSGLAATGLISGTTSGWYPTGVGPECILEPSASAAVSTGAIVGGWNGTIKRRGGASWFLYDASGIQMLIPGYYDFGWWTNQPGGSGQADYHTRLMASNDTTIDWISNVSIAPLSSSYFSRVGGDYTSLHVRAGQRLRVYLSAGSLNVHNVTTGGTYPSTRGQMFARYVRPALV